MNLLQQTAEFITGPEGRQGEYYVCLHQQDKEYLRYRLLGENLFVIWFEMHFTDLDRGALEEAIDTVIGRHESLRTVFRYLDGKMQQFIYSGKPPGFVIQYDDLFGHPDIEAKVTRIYEISANKDFDFENGPLIDIRLVRYSERMTGMLFTMHHVISDAQSIGNLKQELEALYAARIRGRDAVLPPIPMQLRDYGAWVNDRLTHETGLEGRIYYAKKIKNSLAREDRAGYIKRASYTQLLEQELARATSADGEHAESVFREAYGRIVNLYPGKGGSYRTYIDGDTMKKMEELAAGCNTTFFAVVVASFAILFRKLRRWPDTRVYVPITTRVLEEFEPIVGWLVGEMILCVQVEEDGSVFSLLQHVTDELLETANHRFYPYEWIMRDLDIPLPVLAPVFLNLETPADEPIYDFTPAHRGEGSDHFDFKCVLQQHSNGVIMTVDYSRSVYAPEFVENMMRVYQEILHSGALDAGVSIKHLLTHVEQ